MADNNDLIFEHLPEPKPITEQHWPEGTKPLVTTRTMTYMHEKYIRDCIEGILIQKTTFPVQVLIHDDASTDNTANIVREYEAKYPNLITGYYQKENSYSKSDRYQRREAFHDMIQGKYVAICEGDDYWTDPLKLQKQASFLEENPDYGLVHTDNSTYVESSARIIPSHKRVYYPNPPSGEVFDALVRKNFISTLTVMYRMELRGIIVKRLRQWLDSSLRRDYSSWLEISRISKIAYLDDITACYRVHEGSITKSNDRADRAAFGRSSLNISLAFARYYGSSRKVIRSIVTGFVQDRMPTIARYPEHFSDIRNEIIQSRPKTFRSKVFWLCYWIKLRPGIIKLHTQSGDS